MAEKNIRRRRSEIHAALKSPSPPDSTTNSHERPKPPLNTSTQNGKGDIPAPLQHPHRPRVAHYLAKAKKWTTPTKRAYQTQPREVKGFRSDASKEECNDRYCHHCRNQPRPMRLVQPNLSPTLPSHGGALPHRGAPASQPLALPMWR
jgi:hypothetical protein